MRDGGRVTWPALEARLAGRPGWRRRGREWHGPCPVVGVGNDTCWFAAGAVDAIRGGCRRCGGRLDARALAEHLAAVGAREWTGQASPARPRRPPARRGRAAPARPPAAMPAAVWRAAGVVEAAGLAYLRRRLGCDPVVPASVRWLSRSEAARVRPDGEGRRVVVPSKAVGGLVYRFAAPGDSGAAAVQLEAVDAGGRRVPWGRGRVKRWSVPGSDFDGGACVFVAEPGRPGAGAWVCEGPMDALAVAVRERASGVPFLDGAAVLGVAGTAGFRPAAVAGVAGPIVLALQGDGPGVARGRVLERRLVASGRSVRVLVASVGEDWAESIALEVGEIDHG